MSSYICVCVCVRDAVSHSKAKAESVLREKQRIWKPARFDQLEEFFFFFFDDIGELHLD